MTTTKKVDFTGVAWGSVPWTMVGTLYLRAYEYRSPGPSVLGDRAAAEAVDRIEYDFARMRRAMRPRGNQYVVALRARRFDRWAASFLARHPDAVVLHLGCGLDSRVFRLDPPETVAWFDVDVPEVIELRRRIFDERPGYRMLASSVTEPGWLEEIPRDRPALVVAEGVLMYLDEPELRTLLDRLTDRFPSGELQFDGVPPWALKITKIQRWGTRDARELERWNPRLHLVERASALSEYADIPDRYERAVFHLCALIPPLRNFSRLFRFTF